MNDREALWPEHQRCIYMRPDPKLYLRPDPKLYLRHDAHRFLPPQADEHKYSPDQPHVKAGSTDGEQCQSGGDETSERLRLLTLKSELAALQYDRAKLRFDRALFRWFEQLLRKANYNPAQSRWPVGSGRISGRWSGRAELGLAVPAPHSNRETRPIQLASDITGFTRHGINQTINRRVSPSAILNAVINPIQILPQANGTIRYVGNGAVVVLNPSGQVVTVWGR
jgi:hypothetical protein